ncbi:hypothetical protein V2S05_10670, partial [Microbacterium sp. OR16]
VPGKKNVVALIAMIVAIVGFIFACVPGALTVGWVLLPIAFVLSIVSLFLKGGRKWMGVVGLVVSIRHVRRRGVRQAVSLQRRGLRVGTRAPGVTGALPRTFIRGSPRSIRAVRFSTAATGLLRRLRLRGRQPMWYPPYQTGG